MNEPARILVIDDDPENRELLRDIFTPDGYEVMTAEDGDSGLETVRAEHFDLVFLDLEMPGKSGVEVLPLLKAIDPEVRVIILTAHESLQSPMEAREQGAYDFVLKPCDIEELKKKVARACRNGTARAQVEPYELSETNVDPSVVAMIPKRVAKTFEVIAVSMEDQKLVVAMADPFDVVAIDTIKAAVGHDVDPRSADREKILEAMEMYYGEAIDVEQSMQDLLTIETESEESTEPDAEQLRVEADDAPVVRLVNLIMLRAMKEGASDIHIEPRERTLAVRFRIDGRLQEITPPPKSMQAAVISRIKIMGDMDIAERRVPQDGRCKISAKGKKVDLRISTLPTVHGEKVVLRLLDKSNLFTDINDLGFEPDGLEKFLRTIQRPHGMMLLTGPTGSGKTTTLYSALAQINSPDKNIITVEHPVEYEVEGINQVHAHPEIGLTFASALRAILRQDPDVVMIGEIRDLETAKIAIQAAQTGHLVFSTLHTNDAVSTVNRLMYIGVEPYLIVSSLNLIIAQRLVRRVCSACKEPYTPPQDVLDRLGANTSDATYYRGRGCDQCGGDGYKGRAGIHEVFEVTRRIEELILKGATEQELLEGAIAEGMSTLTQTGIHKAAQGITTLEEILSATVEFEE